MLHELRELLGERFSLAFSALSLVQAALTIWMLVDASRRHVEYYWYWIILGFQPIGVWAYFVLYKWSEMGAFRGRWRGLFQRRVSLDELRYRAEQLPTLVNRVALAERLMEDGENAEALPYLLAAYKSEPDHGEVIYRLALCHARLDRPEDAQPLVERLLAKDPRWRNYLGWHLLIAVRRHRGDEAGTLTACRELTRLAPVLQHQCMLAETLLDQGQTLEARELLQRCLRDYEYQPAPIRRRNSRWAGEARRLLKQADGR